MTQSFSFYRFHSCPTLRSPSLGAAFAVDLATFCLSHALLFDVLHGTSVLVFLLMFWSFTCYLTVPHTTFHILLCKKSWTWPASSWQGLYQENSVWHQICKKIFCSIKHTLRQKSKLLLHLLSPPHFPQCLPKMPKKNWQRHASPILQRNPGTATGPLRKHSHRADLPRNTQNTNLNQLQELLSVPCASLKVA